MLYHLKRSAHVGGNTHFKEMQKSFQGNHLTCLNMCCLKGLARQCQYQTQSHKLIHYVCFGIVFWHILRHEPKTKLPNPCPKPLSFPQWYLHFPNFLQGVRMKPQTQTSLQTLRRGKWWLLPALQTSKKPNNQETKKPRNKETQKKQKKQKQPAGSGTERVVVAILWFCEFCETWYLQCFVSLGYSKMHVVTVLLAFRVCFLS